MTASGLLIASGLAVPLGMSLACFWPGVRERALGWIWAAPIPALLAALFARGGGIVMSPEPLRLTLALDDVGAMLLGGAALLWSAAGFYAATYLRGQPGTGRFAVWWLLTLAGSLGTFMVADMTSFYLAFSVASLSAYGLVSFETTARAKRAGDVYMALALLGEAFILLAFVILALGVPIGNPLIREAVAALPSSPLLAPALILLVLGFGLKMGLAPLHVWMPLAHPVAPMPASAALSGIIVKAGVIGLMRFLPLDAGLPGWGGGLVALGLFTAFYAVAVGITQQQVKTVLAYSTVSQMGVVAAVLGAGMAAGAPGTALLAAFYALHHLLVKGALFLGVGIVAGSAPRHRILIVLAMGVLALSLAGLPLTSGALAKYAAKPLFGDGLAAALATLSAVGSTLLMLHFLRLLREMPAADPDAAPEAGILLPWAIVALASLVMPWILFQPVAGYALADLFEAKALWTAIWPLLLGGVLAIALFRIGRALPQVPEGDVIVLAGTLWPLVQATGRQIETADRWLRQWPVASAMLIVIAISFALAL
ncbi:MAG: NADH/ubiquinone/plastoquinone (complex I) [Methylocystis sp.]|nr:NADH/ubiquinone/plastoquinone (complex I) [Methylocystis sp.]MCA3585106.1 NADH/ubiquinone/plastoquinone (complex I) [Methylocystis sp.]MCA3589062.1 NADH/ubiquinone/plastoquinone (complex I) [Methylocystis sp.]MCA3592324.1 NADH/ubiquinone/plastoquinone (complex I) [Methylocystis sp.]